MSEISNSVASYSLRKSRGIMKSIYAWYKRKGNDLPKAQLEKLEKDMADLDDALLKEDRDQASVKAKDLEKFANVHCKKTFFEYAWEFVGALIFALIIATLVRQMWFELYEIPTGSMRPTFREQDHLTVTKTAFGINFPLKTEHLYFDPSLVQRSSVLIFSGDGLPLRDVDTKYFGIFPYKKRYIKRNIGLPGDSLYFYGGQIYGVDRDENEIVELRESPWMQNLEYIPFMSFEGMPVRADVRTVLLKHMNRPYGKLSANMGGQIEGEVFDGKQWVKDLPLAQLKSHDQIETYSDIFGIRNYALARLLTKEELKYFYKNSEDISEGVLYLQLRHTPSLTYPKPIDERGNFAVIGYDALIPLQQHHLETLMNNLYTARFVVKDGRAKRYSLGDDQFSFASPEMEGVPDGTYEFYFGKGSKINWGGISSALPSDSILYSTDPKNVQKLFNLGIEMSMFVAPTSQNQVHFPNRYVYFRNGDLYALGKPLLSKEDPTLIAFNENEGKKQKESSLKSPYVGFKDYGPPLKDGKIDVDFIRTFGVTVPDRQYLVLGDNHAMSSDSRIFGFVPENNLQGAPSWIIWPPGDRLGDPPQKSYPFLNLPRAIIWMGVALMCFAWWIYQRTMNRKPIFKKVY